MVRKVLLICGILSSLLCIGTDIFAAMSWVGYSYTDQAVSELTAVGASTRPFVIPLLIVVQILGIAFGTGVWRTAGNKRTLRITGILLVLFGVIGLISFFFPMNPRGAERSLTDTMHLAFGGVAVLLMVMFIGFGAAAFGRWFRLYSGLTIVLILVFGALAGLQGPHVPLGLPTPWMGVMERVSYYLPYLWILVFAIVLLRDRGTEHEKIMQVSS
jgi:hypothetical protein